MCRYAQFYTFISVIELPRIPAYRPKSHNGSRYKNTANKTLYPAAPDAVSGTAHAIDHGNGIVKYQKDLEAFASRSS